MRIQHKLSRALLRLWEISATTYENLSKTRLGVVFSHLEFHIDVEAFAKHLVLLVSKGAVFVPPAVVFPTFRLGCNGWQVTSSTPTEQHRCRFCLAHTSPVQYHLLECDSFLNLPGSLPGVA